MKKIMSEFFEDDGVKITLIIVIGIVICTAFMSTCEMVSGPL